jgi:hypothetical protein
MHVARPSCGQGPRTPQALGAWAWENVCPAKEDGGLGIRRLDTQNAYLLLKLVHRLHLQGSAWAQWVRPNQPLGSQRRTSWDALGSAEGPAAGISANHDRLGGEQQGHNLLA